jgi:hypothetical protein
MTNPPPSTIFAAHVRKQIDSGANHASAPIANYRHQNDTHRLQNNQAAKINIIHSVQCTGKDIHTQYNYKLSINLKPPPSFSDKWPSSGKHNIWHINSSIYLYILYVHSSRRICETAAFIFYIYIPLSCRPPEDGDMPLKHVKGFEFILAATYNIIVCIRCCSACEWLTLRIFGLSQRRSRNLRSSTCGDIGW